MALAFASLMRAIASSTLFCASSCATPVFCAIIEARYVRSASGTFPVRSALAKMYPASVRASPMADDVAVDDLNSLSMSYDVEGPLAADIALFAPPAAACAPPLKSDEMELAAMAATTTVANDQVTSPCAVSRKNTSWVCVPTHRVRNRPAT